MNRRNYPPIYCPIVDRSVIARQKFRLKAMVSPTWNPGGRLNSCLPFYYSLSSNIRGLVLNRLLSVCGPLRIIGKISRTGTTLMCIVCILHFAKRVLKRTGKKDESCVYFYCPMVDRSMAVWVSQRCRTCRFCMIFYCTMIDRSIKPTFSIHINWDLNLYTLPSSDLTSKFASLWLYMISFKVERFSANQVKLLKVSDAGPIVSATISSPLAEPRALIT